MCTTYTNLRTLLCIYLCTGVADVLSAGCVYIGDSSSQQVAQFTSGQPANQQVDPLISTIDYDLYTERLEECNITFDAANPRTSSYKTVVIRNYRSPLCPNTYPYAIHLTTCTCMSINKGLRISPHIHTCKYTCT